MGMYEQNKNGYVTLISVLVAGAVALSAVLTLIDLSIITSRAGIMLERSSIAKALASTCAEEALENLRENPDYAGNETLVLSTGTCVIRPILGSGNTDRTVQTSGTAGTNVQKLEVKIAQIRPAIQLTSWREISDFP